MRIRPLLLIAGAVLIAYANTLSVPFVFDDVGSIVENASIRSFTTALQPPSADGLTVAGRPLLNLSLAVNYTVSGTEPWSYHLTNILIHLGAALLGFGVLLRTLRICGVETADRLALLVTLLWALHPLQTEAVTYTIQRGESLMGLFYLGTFYALHRAAEHPERKRWGWVAVGACAAGMMTKEVMATAPVLLVLYDRAFLAGNFRAVWQQRGKLHLALASTWVISALLLLSTGGDRGGTFALHSSETAWQYWRMQPEAVCRYLQLSVWPAPLVFDYGFVGAGPVWSVAACTALEAALLIVAVWSFWRHPRISFLLAAFVVLLMPTSLLPGSIQAIVEHRVYLPLMAVLVGASLVIWRIFGSSRGAWLLAFGSLALGGLTVQRNAVYRDEFALWSDTVAKRPQSAIGQSNLGRVYYQRGDMAKALEHFSASERLDPRAPKTAYNVGLTLAKLGRNGDAAAAFSRAVERHPAFVQALEQLGTVQIAEEKWQEASATYRRLLALQPNRADVAAAVGEATLNAGLLLAQQGKLEEAERALADATRFSPENAAAHRSLGNVLLERGDVLNALTAYREALRLEPESALGNFNYARALWAAGDLPGAEEYFRKAWRLDPDLSAARDNARRVRRARLLAE